MSYHLRDIKIRGELVSTPDGFDIHLNGIELGSYGIRQHKGWIWAYGTGYADPRFTIVTDGL